MPAAIKRLPPVKISSTKSKAALFQLRAPESISKFTRVSKDLGNIDRQKNVTSTPRKEAKLTTITPASRKRKTVAPIQDDDSSADEQTPRKIRPLALTSNSSSTPVKRGRGRPPKKARPAPATLKRARSPSVSDSDQSTINTGKLFKRLRLESSPSRSSSPLTANTSIAGSEGESDIQLRSAPTLPLEVLTLVDLNAAILETLTIHYAHNGSNVPADLRTLCPNVARTWGKKKVTDADIRVCLGVLNTKNSYVLFTLSNYGRGKICIEISSNRPSGPLNENKLNNLFRNNLENLWSEFVVNGSSDASKFTNSLPKADITVCDSLTKASPILIQGQKRLEELKKDFAINKQEKESKPTAAAASSPLTNADGSKMSLLDRIRYKQLQKASLPAGFSPAQLERRAALQRVVEVASMIAMLSQASSGGQGRISFTMVVMLEKLKDSFRMGISKEEGAVCVRLLANDVAPEWVRVVTIGQKENVVLETDRQLNKLDIERRVSAIVANE